MNLPIDPDTGDVQIPPEWRIIPGTKQQYAATPEGHVVRLPRTVKLTRQGKPVTRSYPAKQLDESVRDSGHLVVGLNVDGERSTMSVHRLICRAYHGEPPDISRNNVLHGDGDPTNNRPDNLRWGTAAENSQDRVAHGYYRALESSPRYRKVFGDLRPWECWEAARFWPSEFWYDFDYRALPRCFDRYSGSIRDLAADIGVSVPTLKRWMTGKSVPNRVYVQLMADVFDVAPQDFYKLKDVA